MTPPVGIHPLNQNPELCNVHCLDTLGPPPPYEEALKSSHF